MILARHDALADGLALVSKEYDFVVGHGLGVPQIGLIADNHFSHMEWGNQTATEEAALSKEIRGLSLIDLVAPAI